MWLHGQNDLVSELEGIDSRVSDIMVKYLTEPVNLE